MRCLAITLCFTAMTLAQEPKTVAEILDKSARVYKDLHAYHFICTNRVQVSGGRALSEGTTRLDLTALRPDKFRLLRKGSASELVCVNDGNAMWVYSVKQKQFTRHSGRVLKGDADDQTVFDDDPIADAQELLVDRFEALGSWAQFAQLRREDTFKFTGRKANCWVIAASLPQSAGTHELWIGQSTYLVLRDIQTQKRTGGKGEPLEIKLTMTMQRADLDISPEPPVFSFSPPSNATEVVTLPFAGVRGVLATGSRAPNFQLKDLQGNEVSLASLRGKVAVLDFWATWCPPCRAELPSIERLHQGYKDEDVVVVGVNDEEDAGKVLAFLKKNSYSFPTALDAAGKMAATYRIHLIPSVLIIDRDGVIARYYVGRRSERELRAAVDSVLGRRSR